MDAAQLLAREQIRDLVLRYCRAVDRRDFATLRELYHPDAEDDHGGMFSGNAMDFIDALPKIMQPMLLTAHYVANHLIRIDGSQAQGELYSIAWHRMKTASGVEDFIAGGRYLDHYECRDGRSWKFQRRQIVADWVRLIPAPVAEDADKLLAGVASGRADATDPSCAVLPLLASLGVPRARMPTAEGTADLRNAS